MRVGEAFEKVRDELEREARAHAQDKLSDGIDLGDLSMEQLSDVLDAVKLLEPYTYGDSIREFIQSRGTKAANEILAELSQAEDLRDAFSAVLDEGLTERWLPKFLQVFAMGYSFAAPEYREVPRDKEGFLKLCREVDRDLIAIQVAQFSQDALLRENIDQRLNRAASYMSQLFTFYNRPVTRGVVRDWIEKVHSSVTLDCFITGQKVRNLIEEEAAFEAMMHEEND